MENKSQIENTILNIFQLLAHTYKSEFKNTHPDDLKAEMKVWMHLLGCYDPNLVQRAIITFINTDTKGFSPKIGQIKEIMFNMKYEFPQFEDLWCIFEECNRLSYSAVKCWNELPDILQKLISIPNMKEFSMISSEYQKAKFKECIEIRYSKYKEDMRIEFSDNWIFEKQKEEKVRLLDSDYKPKRFKFVFVPEKNEYTYVIVSD